MKCPITYTECGAERYSPAALKKFSRYLTELKKFPYSAEQQRKEAIFRADKMSIQGVQYKLSARLNLQKKSFEITDKGGKYIIKPQSDAYPELPENEALSMKLAAAAGIEVPFHGLIYCEDNSLSYFIKRFDRTGRKDKLAVEDFAQLTENDRSTKYKYSMEKLVLVLNKCTFPVIERVKLFRRCIFNYIIGNEDMHLKNFSLIRRDNKIELSPAYDLLSTTIVYQALGKPLRDIEEIALPLKGNKKGLSKSMWFNYFARQRLNLNEHIIENEASTISHAFIEWKDLIDTSFLSDKLKLLYNEIIYHRGNVLGLDY